MGKFSLMRSYMVEVTQLSHVSHQGHCCKLSLMTKGDNNLVSSSYLMIELKVQFCQEFLPTTLLQGKLWLGEEMINYGIICLNLKL